MKLRILLPVVVAAALLTGCVRKVRSISDTGYHSPPPRAVTAGRELNEMDVLGLDPATSATEEDIERATREARPVRLTAGSTILLIQSGAAFPDGAMVTELGKHFQVVPFTGLSPGSATLDGRDAERIARDVTILTDASRPVTLIPLNAIARATYRTPATPSPPGAYARNLRLAAARAGASTLVCYWGILESASEDLATRTVTWVPGVNWILPHEKQHMRIKLKLAVVDVETGNWSVFSVQPTDATAWSRKPRREAADLKLVESSKRTAYELAAKHLTREYAGLSADR